MNNMNLIDLGLGKVCRACLTDEGEMKSVFLNSDDCGDSDIQLFKMFECCASIEISENDGLPAVICLACELRLNSAYNFRELCQRSNITLRKYIENAMRYNVKQEVANDNKNVIQDSEPVGETEIEYIESVFEDDIKSDNDEHNNENSDDSDEKPLKSRNKGKVILSSYDEEIVNQAIEETKKKNNKRRECIVCGFISSNSRGLSLHISHLHKELKERWCNICFEQVEDLASHSKEHNKARSFSCSLCEKSFSYQGHLTEHIRSHSVQRPYKCKECKKGFLSSRHLRVHERIHSGEKPYSCPHCGRGFTQKGSLQGHIRTHTGFKPYRCEICGKECTTSSALALHRARTGHNNFTKVDAPEIENVIVDELMETVEEENLDAIKIELSPQPAPTDLPTSLKDSTRKLCTVCGKIFSTASKLRLHMRIHTGETPYKCQYCAKRFSTRGQLVVHVRTHTGERPHVCHVCGKGFAQSSVLNTHMKLHTGRPEQCQVCQQRFCRPAELRLHMRKHTGEKPYLCTECGQAFIQRSHLMEHIKIHSDERPYKCHLCERAFKQSSSLKSHIQIHTGYKPYKCSQCPYACRQPYSLTQHMKQHAQDAPQPNRPHVCLICHRAFSTMAMLTSHSRSVHQAIF